MVRRIGIENTILIRGDVDYEFTVVIERDEDGVYVASVPALPGCNSFGDTEEEAREMIKEAIQLYVGHLWDVGESNPAGVETTRVRVSA